MNQELEQLRPTGLEAHVCEFGVAFVPTFDVERSYEPDADRIRSLLELIMPKDPPH